MSSDSEGNETEITESQPNPHEWFAKQARTHMKQCSTSGQLQDINSAIELLREALSKAPRGHLAIPAYLDELAGSLLKRFERLGDLEDINQAVEHGQHALSLTPKGQTDMSSRLHFLGCSLQSRFKRSGDIQDINRAIENHQHALSLTPEGHSSMLVWLNNLGYSLWSRFECQSDLADLKGAIEHQELALSLAPDTHPYMPVWLNNIGNMLKRRFDYLADLVDLDVAIEHQQRALLLAPEGHPYMPVVLDSLADSLRTRFQRLSDLADLDRAIKYQQHVLSITPDGHPLLVSRLNNLSFSLLSRFHRRGDIVDLRGTMEQQQRIFSLTPSGPPDLLNRLKNLRDSLSKPGGLDVSGVADQVIEQFQDELSLTPDEHRYLPVMLSSLSFLLLGRFQRRGDLADLDKAIENQKRGLSLTPDGHPQTYFWLSSLGDWLRSRFERLGELHQSSEISGFDNNIEYTLLARLIGDCDDLHQAILCYQKVALSVTSTPNSRFQGALTWAKMCDSYLAGASLDAYKQVMAILPQLVWIGGSVELRYSNIMSMGDACAKAASAAIAKNNYHSALEWLEEGRSIVWRQIMQLRDPFNELCAVEPSLAAELKQIARDLDHAASPTPVGSAIETLDEYSLDAAARWHRRLAEKWEQLIIRARQIPGLECFLRPRQASELTRSSHSGTVVMLNIHESRCDALVIRPRSTEILCVPLSRFSYGKATDISTRMAQLVRSRGLLNRGFKLANRTTEVRLEETLTVLWNDLVKPVLDFLGYTHKALGENMPHITWCTTGPLSFLPIHAAGDYGSQTMIFDYVVSSYTPTLGALLTTPRVPSVFSGMLAVGQTSIPGLDPLPGTAAELDQIQERFQGLPISRLDGSEATPAVVLASMEEASWVHFACHANQDLGDPTKSTFYLHGGMLDLASITRKQLKKAELAFLSACQTATGDKALTDEAVHLAAGMLTAGFRTVIATMWSIGDEDAPLIADKVYEHLLEGGTPDARKAAVAVHKATEYLRAKVGLKEIVKWAPYVHIGM